MIKKRIFCIAVCFLLTASIYSTGMNFDNTQDKNSQLRFVNLERYSTGYWSLYGAAGSIALTKSIVEIGAASYVTQKFYDLSYDYEKYGYNGEQLRNYIKYYPYIMFGFNFMAAGFAFIPVTGGVVYGAAMFTAGIGFSIIKTFSYFQVNTFSSGSTWASVLNNKVNEYNKLLFEPAPYYVIGTISILTGVAEIIMWFYYNQELKKSKFPYNQRRFAFKPGDLSLTIYL